MKLKCGHEVIILDEDLRKEILSKLEKQLTASFGGKSVVLPKDFIVSKTDCCYVEHNCNDQIYVNGDFYCFNQRGKK